MRHEAGDETIVLKFDRTGFQRGYDEMGCLLALFAGAFPRLGLFMFWVLRPARVDAAFDTWIFPLLGIIFLPFATLMYAVLWTTGGLSGWEWFWVAIAAVFDVSHWAVGATQRDQVPGRRRGEVDLAP
jgi:hypothetical protein